MTGYSVAALLVITGVCVLAAVCHMSAGLWRPIDKSNILFSVMCCCAAGTASQGASGAGAGARLLLADDDSMLLESPRSALEADGHHVMTADDGQSAIDAFEAADKAGAPFAAVISDFVMPIIDGRSVSTAVNQIRPGTPVIMLTGWGNRVRAQGDTLRYVDHILASPRIWRS